MNETTARPELISGNATSIRRWLSWSVAAGGSSLLLLLAIPFLSALKPSAAAKNNYEKNVPLASIPSNGFVEVEWNRNRVFLQNAGEVRAFLMPFIRDSYLLPDLSWGRAYIPCHKFGFEAGYFQCFDSDIWRMVENRGALEGKRRERKRTFSPSSNASVQRSREVCGARQSSMIKNGYLR